GGNSLIGDMNFSSHASMCCNRCNRMPMRHPDTRETVARDRVASHHGSGQLRHGFTARSPDFK
ncbi:MAG TPA: hypothetical protein VGO18_24030, partial [Steroidobacteraceae bacterium]|nr:hypothetical protein [Steroidobacteraceae bacterium]